MHRLPQINFAPEGIPTGFPVPPGRFDGIKRDYSVADVEKLAGSFRVKHTLAEMGANRLWSLLHSEPYVNTLGALTGNQAMQQVKAGLKAIYLSGWQVAADANNAGEMYPGPIPLPGLLGPAGRCKNQQFAAPRRPDCKNGRRYLAILDGAHHRRCRGRLRRRAECL